MIYYLISCRKVVSSLTLEPEVPGTTNLRKQSLSINLKNSRRYAAADSKPRETISVKEQLEEKKMKRQNTESISAQFEQPKSFFFL